MSQSFGALEGVRVLDLSRVLAGPYCTMILGDLGAEIIKVEPPGGDDTRGYPPFKGSVSAYYVNLNRNKRSIVINLKTPEGKDLLTRLAAKSDVLVENFRPGTMDSLGLGYEKLSAVNPRLIYACISGFGQYGPYSDRPGYDIIGQAMGGIMSVTGWPDSPPTRTGTAIGDVLGGLNACIGILAALKSRERTGRGQKVDVALVDSVVSAMETILEIYLVEGRIPERIGNRYEFIYPYDSFPTLDGWVVIGVGNDEVWRRFCVAMERPDLQSDSRLTKNKDRVANHEILFREVSAWTRQWKSDDLVKHLTEHSVPCAPILGVDKIVNDPHIAVAREMFGTVTHREYGEVPVTAVAIKMSDTKATIRTAAPTLGENGEEIVRNVLGMSDEEIQNLGRTGALLLKNG